MANLLTRGKLKYVVYFFTHQATAETVTKLRKLTNLRFESENGLMV